MPDAPAPPAKAESTFGFLGHKIFGIPVWVIAGAALGGWYWYTHYGPGAAKATASTTTPAGPTVIEVRGPRGPAGPAAPEDQDVRHRKIRRPPPQRFRGAQPAAAPPAPAAAPMTSGATYGAVPVATGAGDLYDSGLPLAGEYVAAG
jgi:hypothetical protein